MSIMNTNTTHPVLGFDVYASIANRNADIAKHIGLSPETLGKYVRMKYVYGKMPERVMSARSLARTFGYIDLSGKKGAKKADEILTMLRLREKGLSNAEICKRTGHSSQYVLDCIGNQDNEMTRMNLVMGQKIRWQKEEARANYLLAKASSDLSEKKSAISSAQKNIDAVEASISDTQNKRKSLDRLLQNTLYDIEVSQKNIDALKQSRDSLMGQIAENNSKELSMNEEKERIKKTIAKITSEKSELEARFPSLAEKISA